MNREILHPTTEEPSSRSLHEPRRRDSISGFELIAFLLLLCVPWVAVLLVPAAVFPAALTFWFVMILCLALAWLLLAPRRVVAVPSEGPRMLLPDEQPAPVRDVMEVRFALEEDGAALFRGPLRGSAEATFRKLRGAFGPSIVPLVQEDEKFGARILLVPRAVEKAALEKPVRPWIHWLLFALTIATTTWAGALHRGINILHDPAGISVGLPYALGLLCILGIHELGHYFTARRHGMNVTPPYFIPVPFALGTFGAFIKMKSPPENRRALFDVAIAGPLAGLAVAIPALLIGLQHSTIDTVRESGLGILGGTSVHASILFALLTKFSLGPAVTYDSVVHLSPLAFAGWLGFFVTALNLLPVGQLDGGHITRSMFGTQAGAAISSVAMWSIFLLALFVWPGLMLWALIIFFIARRGTPPLNDVTPISGGRRALGWFTFAILAMILCPLPQSFWYLARIICPYC